MQALPLIQDPGRYEGLFVYDFGTHVSVGYTAAEILMLRQSPEFGAGTALQIYRVDENGAMELRGIQDAVLTSCECLCFLQSGAAGARQDYDRLKRAASESPLSVVVEARLARSYKLKPPDLSALIFPAWAGHQVSGWLNKLDWSPGERVISGAEALASLNVSGGLTIDTCTLASNPTACDREVAQVLASTGNALQR